jgi:hypothetical protein
MQNERFVRVFENEVSKSVWKYDLTVTKNGPVSVSITQKDNSPYKSKLSIGDYAKMSKKKSK